jgi:Fe2+ or Zn2+ uptake regulation protein
MFVRSPAELTADFRSMGLKVTPQRQLLFRLLHDNTTHPTAEAIFEEASARMPGISLRTVYQTLTDLTTMGELQSFTFGGGATRFDPNVGTHHHRVCVSCAEVGDVYVDGAELLYDTSASPEANGFAVAATDIVFRGVCARCAETRPSSALSSTRSETSLSRKSTTGKSTRSQ